MCHECKVKDAIINGLREQVAVMQERGRVVTSMYLPESEIRERGLSPRAIRDRVNGFVKD